MRLKKDALAFSVVEIATTLLTQHWLANVSLFFGSKIMVEDPSAVVTVLDNAIFWMDDHVSSAESKDCCDNHNKFHFWAIMLFGIFLFYFKTIAWNSRFFSVYIQWLHAVEGAVHLFCRRFSRNFFHWAFATLNNRISRFITSNGIHCRFYILTTAYETLIRLCNRWLVYLFTIIST